MIRLKVKEVAQSKGYNMSTLSRSSGVSFMTIKRIYKQEQYDVHLSTLYRIALVLDVPVCDLFEVVN
jgi:DNA-binding Xre family transcriptional regulator